MKKAKSLRITTIRALSAAHAVGLTHWGEGPFSGFDWAVDGDGFYHAVRRQTPRGGEPRAMHACRAARNRMTAELERLKLISRWEGPAVMSQEYTRLELGLVCPSWLCDHDSDWTACSAPSTAIAPLCLDVAPEDQQALIGAVK
jgi:hypothetical protein